MFTETVSYWSAILAGLLSFFSPCVLPLIPAYFSLISGYSLEELTESHSAEIRRKVFLSTVSYVSGFSLVFVLMGASATYLGSLVLRHSDLIRIAGAIIVILLGIHLTGVIRIRGLDFEKRIHLKKRPLYFGGTFMVGMAFGVGWSPCIGPLLGSILIVAGNQETVWQGIRLLAIYSAGLAFPFIVMSIFVSYLLSFIKRTSKAIRYVNAGAGIFLTIVGILLLTNRLFLLNVPR
jgi:cytochrome c-type biogenesis protein